MSTYKILGINDEVTVCECCSKTNLKKTVILTDGLVDVRFGVNCAALALGKSQTKIKNTAEMAERERTRPIKYYMVFNLTDKVYVVNGETKTFATLELAEKRVARMANNGLTGRIDPIYAN